MSQISPRVMEELETAASHVRNALSFASRAERPATIKHLGSILESIESVKDVDRAYEAVERTRAMLYNRLESNGETPNF